jgi:precorrin-2 methylase
MKKRILKGERRYGDTNADLFLLGSGIHSFFDVTLYTQSVLQKCSTVFYLHDLPSLDQYLMQVTAKPINLMPLYYHDGRNQRDIYEDIVSHVLHAVEKQRPVALILHGNPILYSTISRRLLEECSKRAIETEVVPAISCLDRIFVDLRLDIAERGLQIYEASRAIRRSMPIINSADLLVLQIASIRRRASRNETARIEDVLKLKHYLRKFYPPTHKMYVIESSVEIGFSTLIAPIILSKLEQVAKRMTYTASLFVPACIGAATSRAGDRPPRFIFRRGKA